MMDKIKEAAGLAKFAADRKMMDERASSNLVGLFIGLMVAAIVAVSVFIPVVTEAIADNENLSGNTETILELLPLFAALLLLIALAAPLMRRV